MKSIEECFLEIVRNVLDNQECKKDSLSALDTSGIYTFSKLRNYGHEYLYDGRIILSSDIFMNYHFSNYRSYISFYGTTTERGLHFKDCFEKYKIGLFDQYAVEKFIANLDKQRKDRKFFVGEK